MPIMDGNGTKIAASASFFYKNMYAFTRIASTRLVFPVSFARPTLLNPRPPNGAAYSAGGPGNTKALN